MGGPSEYRQICSAIEPTGMVARGGFVTGPDDLLSMPDGHPVRSVVVVGNVGGALWPHFARQRRSGPNPLDTWTRATLQPIARHFGAAFVHPSDQPFQPFQRWAQRADAVWQSPIGLLIHRDYGLWHAYRGALLFADVVTGLPAIDRSGSPCGDCVEQPCLSTCPVGAFDADGYDSAACAGHVRSGGTPDCLGDGCAARRACPVGTDLRYDPEQIQFHMRAFVGDGV